MVVSDSQAILKSLKVFYKDGMKSLLARDGTAVKEVPFRKVEGKTYNFSAIAGRGGAVAGNWLEVKAKAGQKGLQAEFAVEPGNIWSGYTVLKTELAAGKTNLGAYMPILGREFYRATAGLRQTLAASMYGRGYGEIGVIGTAVTGAVGDTVEIALPKDAVIKIDVDSDIVVKSNVSDAEENATLAGTVTALLPGFKGVKVSVTKAGTAAVGNVVCIAGSTVPGTNSPILPMGLDGWLPIVAGRTGTDWDNYIGTTFFAQNRSAAPDRMAGQYYEAPTGEAKKDTLENALYYNRIAGGNADIIIVNTEDRAALSHELTTLDRFHKPTDSKKATKVNVGNESFSVSAATNFVDLIVDDAFCPKGKFYVGSRDAWEYAIWFSKQNQNKDDGVDSLEAGKQQPEDLSDFNFDNGVSKLNVEDYISIIDGVDSVRGPGVLVSLGFMGALVVTDPSAWVVGTFADVDKTQILGYTA